MNRRYILYILLFIALLLSACSSQEPQSAADKQFYSPDYVYILSNEDELKEQLLKSKSRTSYDIEFYYRPANKPDNMTLKRIELDQYNVKYTYAQTADTDDIEYTFVWRFSQRDGNALLQDSIERLGYQYVYPANPAEGATYVSDLNRNEANKAGRNSWDLDYCVNGVLFSASIPWGISDEDVTTFLQMEKAPLN